MASFSSPMEQGELAESPEVIQLSPDIEISVRVDVMSSPDERTVEYRKDPDDVGHVSDDHEDTQRRSLDEPVEDELHIKPPPAITQRKERRKHKRKESRKHESHGDREKGKHKDRERDKDRGDKDRGDKDRADKDRGDKERDKERRDDREWDRESRVKQKEEESRRRDKSRRERERLERLERERHRLERERQLHEQEHHDRLLKEQRQRHERSEHSRGAERQRGDAVERSDVRREATASGTDDRRHKSKYGDSSSRREKDRERKSGKRERSRSPQRHRNGDGYQAEREKEAVKDNDEPRHLDDEDVHEDVREDVHEDDHNEHAMAKKLEEREDSEEEDEESSEVDEEERAHSESHSEESQSEEDSDENDDDMSGRSASGNESGDSHGKHATQNGQAADIYGRVSSKFDQSHMDYDDDSADTDVDNEDAATDDDHHEDEDHHLGGEDVEVKDTPPPSPVQLKPDLPPYYPAIQGCRNVEEFNCLNRIEEGTYGVVYRAKDKKTNEIVALKRLKMEKEKDGFPITSLREINTLLKAQHVNIVTVREIVVGSNMDKIYIVMDYVEHDLKSLMESMKEPFIIGEVKTLMIQLLRGVAHLHDNWIIHRDLKTSNLLLSHKGILKIGDFGLAREYGSPLRHYTPIVVTLWYRAPELLLGTKEYSTPIDLWSVGCIFAEFINRKPLFPGKSEIDQLNRTFKELGTPSEEIWPGVSQLPAMKKCTFAEYPYNQLRNRFSAVITNKGFELMNRFLTYNPVRRITAEDALKHEYFQESPLPVEPSMFPTWPARSEQTRRSHGNTPKPPSGGKAYAKLMSEDDDSKIQGFHLVYATKGAAASGAGFALKF